MENLNKVKKFKINYSDVCNAMKSLQNDDSLENVYLISGDSNDAAPIIAKKAVLRGNSSFFRVSIYYFIEFIAKTILRV